MAKQTFKEITAIEAIEPLANGVVQVKEATTVYKGDLVIAKTVHRWCLEPAQDISDQEPAVQAVCNALWTPEVIAAYKAACEQSWCQRYSQP